MKRFQLLALILAFTVLAAWRPERSPSDPSPALTHFSLVLERTGSGWTASCETGCAWSEVAMDCGGCVIRIDSVGMVPAARGRAARGSFAFEVQPERARWAMRGVSGLAWKELGWKCEAGSCPARIDETGVSLP